MTAAAAGNAAASPRDKVAAAAAGAAGGRAACSSSSWISCCCRGRGQGSGGSSGSSFSSSSVVGWRCSSADTTVFKDQYSLCVRHTTDAPNGGVVVGQQLLERLEVFGILRVALILKQLVEGVLEGMCTLPQQWH